MPEWELRALEYIVGAVLVGLVFIATSSEHPLCPLDDPWSLAYNNPAHGGGWAHLTGGFYMNVHPKECGPSGAHRSPRRERRRAGREDSRREGTGDRCRVGSAVTSFERKGPYGLDPSTVQQGPEGKAKPRILGCPKLRGLSPR